MRCRCTTEQEFVQRYAADVCADGMFLRTQQALPVGARVRFELLLQNGRCALGGVGRVAWVRETARDDSAPALRGGCEQQRPGGAGVTFERLRRGDRAVIERMEAVRGEVPSRFEQPDTLAFVRPASSDLGETLFADLGVRSGVEPGASAFLSADLSQELGDGGWQLGTRASSAEQAVADLAEQLEPASESELDADEPEVDVELVAQPAAEPPAAHSTVRPAPVSAARQAAPLAARKGITPAPRSDAPVQSPSEVYAESADSAVSLALARSAVNAANRSGSAPALRVGALKPANAPAAASLRARVDRVSKPKTLTAPPPLRRPPATTAPAAAAKPPAAVPAAPPVPSASVTARIPARPRASTVPVAAALTAIIVLATAVTYLSLTDRLAHLLRAIGL